MSHGDVIQDKNKDTAPRALLNGRYSGRNQAAGRLIMPPQEPPIECARNRDYEGPA